MKITENSYEILTQLVECQILTTTQLSIFNQRSRQVIRRNIRKLESDGFIASKKQGYGQGQGRPEKILFVTEKGMALLKDKGFLSDHATFAAKNSTDSNLIDHRMLTNWFHLHLIHMSEAIPQLSAIFLYPNSNSLKEKSKIFLKEFIKLEGSIENLKFYPDGVFSLKYQDNNNKKSLLFFLEVDMGTETLAGKNRNPNNIRQKVLNYQALFRSEQYKRYNRIFNSNLNGFRLLFLTNTYSRMVSICNIIREMPPSDFIWVANQEKMFSHGLSAEIWARGGKKNIPPHPAFELLCLWNIPL